MRYSYSNFPTSSQAEVTWNTILTDIENYYAPVKLNTSIQYTALMQLPKAISQSVLVIQYRIEL